MTKNIISKLITPSFGGSWKGAFSLIRSDKLYSAMYICCTALAIAFTMLIAEVYYIKTADIAPEVNRSKTYTLERLFNRKGNDSIPYVINLTQEMYRDVFQQMKTPECMKAEISTWILGDWYMKLADGVHDRSVVVNDMSKYKGKEKIKVK